MKTDLQTKELKCSICQKYFPQSFFRTNTHAKTRNGKASRCKPCENKYITEYRKGKKYYQKDHQERVKKSILKHPERQEARFAVKKAVLSGILEKLPCEVCGSTTRIHAHHGDYSKPLTVKWLCHTHHMAIHYKK